MIVQNCFAQDKLDFNVVSFGIDQFSTTAQDKRFEKFDSDGNRYAIIKVKDVNDEGGLEGFTFNFGSLNSIVESHNEELWVYVQRNAKTVTIKRPGYKTIEKYDLNTTIQSGRVYEMRITMSRVRNVVEHDITKQVLQFIVTPSHENAIVKVKKAGTSSDYELWGEVDETGSIDRIIDFGSYDYVVSAFNYVSSTGRLTLSDSKTTFVEHVTLKPNFGFLVVDDANGITGAQLYVDEVKIGSLPFNDPNKRFSSGEHKITITNGDLYKPYNSTFTIQQGDTTRLSPKLESDFAHTTIHVDSDAEILIDGKSVGRRSWTGPLKTGKYVVECKKENHKPTSITINVKADKAETYEVPAPIAITGSAYVRSNPSGATIEIDGKNEGFTPMLVQNLIIGEHTIKLSMTNHKTEEYRIVVKEGQTSNIDGKLSDVAIMTINSKPSNALLSINGESVGLTPYSQEMPSGDYDIRISATKYRDFHQNVHLDSSNPSMEISLKRQYYQPYSFYFQPFIQVGSCMAAGVALGGFLANVNIEAYYDLGLKKSEMIYWNSTTSDDKPCGYSYKASQMGGKLGYGIIFGTRMRLTPQAGFGVVKLSSAESNNLDPSFDASNTYAANATLSAKFEYAVASCIGVYIAPEYSFAVKKGEYYKEMESVSSKIKGFAKGVNVRVGISLFL